MIELKPDELKLWESVYAAYISSGKGSGWAYRCERAQLTADQAVESRRERFNTPVKPMKPYRDLGWRDEK